MRIARLICSSLLAVGLLAIPVQSRAQVAVGISVRIGPPELPIYEQPLCPGEGYIWTPGYWAWDGDGDDYYWVPGTWVLVPEPGFFWTPGYWAWSDGSFIFYEGYWGPVVGFYGGINYGYGYVGHGYEGGRWDNGHFYYNRSVNNVNITEIHNVYNTTVVNNTTLTRVSYNGGNGGIDVRPTPQEEAAAHQKHISPVPAQMQHVQAARANQALRASANHGKPPVAATPRPGALNDRGVVPAKEGGRYNPPPRSETNAAHPGTAVNPPARSEHNADRPPTAVHPKELPPVTRPPAPSTGNPNVDKKYQQEQEKLNARQEQERQKLQQKQDQEHQRMAQQKADEARKQQLEQMHQQQTQQLAQKHAEQQQKLQGRQQPPRQNPPPKPPPKEKP
jgi:YXWGXW repeat-containing protein